MDTIKTNKGSTKVIAHRGLSGLETENTIESFVAAGNRSFFGMECDIHLTKDNHFIISHDDNLKRLTGKDELLCDLTLKEVLKKNIINHNSNYENNKVHFCTLVDFLLLCKKYKKHAVVEVKISLDDKSINALISICNSYYNLDNITFISFNLENMINLRKKLPSQSLQFLVDKKIKKAILICKQFHLNIDADYKLLKGDIIKKCHQNNIVVNCWTVNDVKWAKKLIAKNVDYITTNILE